MTKRTTIYIKENDLKLLEIMKEEINQNQSEILLNALRHYYLSDEYKREKQLNNLANAD